MEIKKGTDLLDRPVLKNRFGNEINSAPYAVGKFLSNQIILESFSNSIVNDDYYDVSLKGFIDKENVSQDIKICEKKGEILGQLMEGDRPLKYARLILVSLSGAEKASTSSDGAFNFNNIRPGEKLRLFIESKVNKVIQNRLLTGQYNDLMVSPGEKINLGKITLDQDNTIDMSSVFKEIKDIKMYISRFSGLPRINVVAYLGKPENKLTKDIWFYKYRDFNIYVAFIEDELKSYVFETKLPSLQQAEIFQD